VPGKGDRTSSFKYQVTVSYKEIQRMDVDCSEVPGMPGFAGILISFIYDFMGYGVPCYAGLISHIHRFVLLLNPNIFLATFFPHFLQILL
jgi:hypothetical protein